jgi:hypothetical protein
VQFLTENTEGSIVESRLFPIGDENMMKDCNTLLLVQFQPSGYDGGSTLIIVRLAAVLVDAEAAAVSIGSE